MKSLVRLSVAAVALFALTVSSAKAAYLDINLAGFEVYGGDSDPLNTRVSPNIGVDSLVTNYEWIGLTFDAVGGSWASDFVFSVEHGDGWNPGGYLDARPASGVNGPGTVGPTDGSWGDAGFGAPFVATTGIINVFAYDTFNDNGAGNMEAIITAGTLRVHYTPVPEPSALALLGLASVGLVARRRRS